MKRGLFITSLVVAGWLVVLMNAAVRGSEAASSMTPDEAIQRLRDGNERFATDRASHPGADAARRRETAQEGQKPFVTVISCSDSRVPVEILFDQGVGDLFTIRVAGNVCGVDEMGSIEYGVDHLGTPVLVVLGHTGCGAVTAVATDAPLHGHVATLVESIRPAVKAARAAHPDAQGKALVEEAITANVWQAADDLLQGSPVVRQRVAAGKLKIVGAIYDLATGRVRWLGPRPANAKTTTPSVDEAVPVTQPGHPEHE